VISAIIAPPFLIYLKRPLPDARKVLPSAVFIPPLGNLCPLSRSLLGVKRTCLFALHMSASDTKRIAEAVAWAKARDD
jgi:hypothetical protein